MKKPPHDPAKKFKASAFSASGFLGSETSDVSDIIAEDTVLLEQLGLSRDIAAATLEALFQKCAGAMGDPVTFSKGITGELIDIRGKLPCPFGRCGYFPKEHAVLSGGPLPAPVIISVLSIHLIKMHGFFQGAGSPFRIDPKVVAEHLMSQRIRYKTVDNFFAPGTEQSPYPRR